MNIITAGLIILKHWIDQGSELSVWMISQLSSPGSQMPPRVWRWGWHDTWSADHIPDIPHYRQQVSGRDHTRGQSVTLIRTSSPDQTHSESPQLAAASLGDWWWNNICEIWTQYIKWYDSDRYWIIRNIYIFMVRFLCVSSSNHVL